MKHLLDQIEEFWCVRTHSALLWPFRGEYRCGVCHRRYPVPFAAVRMQPQGNAHNPALREA